MRLLRGFDITHQSSMFWALDRTTGKLLFELLLGKRAQFSEFRCYQSFPGLKSRLGALFGKTVPRTDILTDIATEDPVLQIGLHHSRQFGIFQLDCAIRDTACAINEIWFNNCAGRTGI